MAFAFLLDEKGSAMRSQDNPDDYKATLELSDGSPTSSVTLLQRLAIRDPEIDAKRAKATLEAAGVKVSPLTASMVINETQRLLRALDKAGLLHDDFDRLRRRRFHDFIERAPKKKRRSSR